MIRRLLGLLLALCFLSQCISTAEAQTPYRAYGRVWGGAHSTQNWERFYHYPYVYYPQNFWGNEYYRSGPSLYHRYPPEMRRSPLPLRAPFPTGRFLIQPWLETVPVISIG